MNDKTTELLTQLADKFGTTVEHLWGVLLKQVPIEAAISVGFTLPLVVAWIYAFWWVKTGAAQDPKPDWAAYGGEGFVWGIMGLAGLGVLMLAGYSGYIVLTAIFNPEYWALKQLLP